MKPITLSERLRAAASMVTAGSRAVDVGCDHGFVSIWLVEQGISPSVLAMDVRSGPLSAAKEHIAERGLEKQIETRLSDGLHNYNIGEADTLICAGMGGGLMRRILTDDKEKTASFHELVLAPQSEVEQFRAWLREQGYTVVYENMIEEDGKFYPMMRVETGFQSMELCKPEMSRMTENGSRRDSAGIKQAEDAVFKGEVRGEVLCKLQDRYGALLLKNRNRTLEAYLRREERIYTDILENLQAQGLSEERRRGRHAEITQLLAECRMALEWFMPGV